MEKEVFTSIRIAALCEKGTRENNEDCFMVNDIYPEAPGYVTDGQPLSCDSSNTLMCGVFDGMGGRAYGEVASFCAASAVSKAYTAISDDNLDADTILELCMRDGNRAVTDKIIELGGCRIGTTGALLYIDGKVAYGANMGDSRLYAYKDGILTQLSHDDNERQLFIEAGMIPPRFSSSCLTAFIGMDGWRTNEFNYSDPVILQGGEKLLLCSDGLSSFLSDERIAEILSQCDSPEEAVRTAVSEASEYSNDNITAVAVYVMSVKDPISPEDLLTLPYYEQTL